MAILVTKWFGVFLVDEKSGKVKDSRLMPHDPHEVAEKLADMQRGNLCRRRGSWPHPPEARFPSATAGSPSSGSLSCSIPHS